MACTNPTFQNNLQMCLVLMYGSQEYVRASPFGKLIEFKSSA